jgi:hypothetical protein
METWTWSAREKDAPAWWRDAAKQSYLFGTGPAGVVEHVDLETWCDVTQRLRGPRGRSQWLNFSMGHGLVEPLRDWPGPGEVFRAEFGESNQRAFYDQWAAWMRQEPARVPAAFV